jgi:hypothetical protein
MNAGSADWIVTLLFFGSLIAGMLDFFRSSDSEEVEQFRAMVESWFRSE